MLFAWPIHAAYGRTVPKNAIYDHIRVSGALKELFIRQVDRIVWEYKLAPETTNIPATEAVPEIQVFSVTLKGEALKTDVLRCIDQAIPFPLLFELRKQGQARMIAAYKRPSEADGNKWVVSGYFASDWLPTDAETPRVPLPVALNMESLYAALLAPLLPYPARQGESLAEHVIRMEQIRVAQRELEKWRGKLKQEKQFNRKIELNQKIRELDAEIMALC